MTMKFASYNAALQFARGSGILNPTKPYKRVIHTADGINVVWCVTLPKVSKAKAQYERIAA